MKLFYLLKLLLLQGGVVLLASCESQNAYGTFDDAIVDGADQRYKFEQLLLVLNLKVGEEYAVLEQIDTIVLTVNGKAWGSFASETLDTTGLSTGEAAGFGVSSLPVNYLVLAPFRSEIEALETAGDFVRLLNGRMVLIPGDYVCSLVRLVVRNRNNEYVTLKPGLVTPFRVEENMSSTYAGQFEIEISQ